MLFFRPVGMPRIEKVIVQNNDPKNSLHLLSISGSTVHFHCSFFQDKVSKRRNEFSIIEKIYFNDADISIFYYNNKEVCTFITFSASLEYLALLKCT